MFENILMSIMHLWTTISFMLALFYSNLSCDNIWIRNKESIVFTHDKVVYTNSCFLMLLSLIANMSKVNLSVLCILLVHISCIGNCFSSVV
jgi:hypothetical protein